MSEYKKPQGIEIETAELWVNQGTIWPSEYGNENTYYMDEFDREYYCKNYPDEYGPVITA